MPAWADSSTLRLFVEFACLLALAQMWNLLAGFAGLRLRASRRGRVHQRTRDREAQRLARELGLARLVDQAEHAVVDRRPVLERPRGGDEFAARSIESRAECARLVTRSVGAVNQFDLYAARSMGFDARSGQRRRPIG